MLETSARLLRLLSLLQGRRDWGGPELAGRLGVSTRTLRADVEKLRGLGIRARLGLGWRVGIGWGLGGRCRRCCWMTRRLWLWRWDWGLRLVGV